MEVTVFVDARQDLTHPSYLYAGLALLAEAGELDLRFAGLAGSGRPMLGSGNVFCQVEVRSKGKRWQVLFDFKDQNDVFCDELQPDFYFKRSFLASKVRKQSVFPLGMPFACRRPRGVALIARDVLVNHRPKETWKGRLSRFRQYWRIEDVNTFLAGPDKVERVIFQTRLWEKHEVADDDLDAVNLPRVSLIRRLRRELGSRFLGGLIPTPRARRDFPDLVREEGVRRDQFLALMRSSAVGISTRGLFHSTPWKLSEYLSAGIAVVTQPVTNQPLDPLIEGKHLLTYESEDVCLSHCAWLLDHRREAAELQRAARAYYETAIDPAAVLRRCLRQVISA